ncbi:MAG: class I SAM-dependent methyltransferase [Verrucomicrobia bacterium]|nr:class I SAM-dependent methyltransferase [Verrucomicrobiota bacterium]
MRPEEAGIIERYLECYRPRRCLEYGIGYSTVVFSRHPFIEDYVGIDHNQDWIDIVRAEGVPEKVRLFCCPYDAGHGPKVLEASISGYVREHAAGAFDFVFVDGIHRNQCLEHAPRLLTPRGFVILHDSARKEHHAHIEKCFRHHRFLIEGEIIFESHWHRGLCLLWNADTNMVLEEQPA